jgi:hypothetical protein
MIPDLMVDDERPMRAVVDLRALGNPPPATHPMRFHVGLITSDKGYPNGSRTKVNDLLPENLRFLDFASRNLPHPSTRFFSSYAEFRLESPIGRDR